ncbi:MAG TPA: FAD-dependent oxidoreductase, partial [Sinorhizobium sp.]|nr:FAD-dependent oxidoreductase [Sinorhizobium sp.]
MSSFVIIGAGECGARAALALRDRGFAGHVTLVGDEELPPYERPPLSKDGIVAGAEPKPVAGTERFAELGIELQLGVAVQSLDRRAKTVVLADGSALHYDKLLLATGSRPRSLPDLPRSDLIRTLRGHADALAIRGLLTGGRRLAILGGGFIGLELAASATKLGASVTVLEARPRILARGVPAAIAERIAGRHRAEGVDLVCDARISTVEEKDGTVHLSLDSGRLISADLLVVGIGSLPNTELAAAAGLH